MDAILDSHLCALNLFIDFNYFFNCPHAVASTKIEKFRKVCVKIFLFPLFSYAERYTIRFDSDGNKEE
jgi:hypothetical protein